MEESDAHDQQIHHERWQHSLCILQEAVLFARWLRRILAGVKRRALLFRVLCGRTISGSAYGLVFRSYGHPFNPTVTIRPEPTAAAVPRTAGLLVFWRPTAASTQSTSQLSFSLYQSTMLGRSVLVLAFVGGGATE